jgi:small redox-active disulfide protein 2
MTTITVLGPGCKRCAALEAITRQAVAQLGLDVTVVKETDYAEMARLGIMSTPALATDGQLAISGSVPDIDKVKRLLAAAV